MYERTADRFKRLDLMAWSALILAALAAVVWWVVEPDPYGEVVIHPETGRTEGGAFDLHASFVKYRCDLVSFAARGRVASEKVPLLWTDTDGIPRGHNRAPGEQDLNVRAQIGLARYEYVEFVTVHDCNGRRVIKTFARFENV